jgi:hypothetical protein
MQRIEDMNMRNLVYCITPFALLAGPAFAQSVLTDTARGSVDVVGDVTRLCSMGLPTPSPVNIGQMVNTGGVRAGQLAAIVNQSVSLPNTFCNYAGTRLTVNADALLTPSTTATGFTKAVNYQAAVAGWGAGVASVSTGAAADGSTPSAAGLGSVVAAPRISDLTLTFSGFNAPADLRPVAGAYRGTVTIVVGPDLSGGVQ